MAYPTPIQKLIDLFVKFPGIGPRQAARFSFYLFKEKDKIVGNLISALKDLEQKVDTCSQCFRSMEKTEKASGFCILCLNPKREKAIIAVVEKESDMHGLEKTGSFEGLYHVLGGVISPLDQNSPVRLHLKELHARIKNILEKSGKCEVVLATNSTTEGDLTALYIERILEPLVRAYPVLKISRLGRGLSLGAELEYADEVTLKNALTNRK